MNPFFETYTQSVDARSYGVYWGLVRGFTAPGPLTFVLQSGATPTDAFTEVARAVDTYNIQGVQSPDVGKELGAWFRLQLIDGNDVVYTSNPFRASGQWTKQHWLLARKICWMELRQIRKGGSGVIPLKMLKRRDSGVRCPHCADRDATDANCRVCYGTGFSGGFFPALDVYATVVAPRTQHTKVFGDAGMVSAGGNKQIRMIAYPQVSPDDVFVDQSAGLRYNVAGVAVASEIVGQPLILVADLKLIELTSPIYFAKFDGAPSVNELPNAPAILPPPALGDVAIQWTGSRWVIKSDTVLYTSTSGVPTAAALPRLSWVDAGDQPADFTVVRAGDNIELTGGSAPGVYTPGPEVRGLPTFIRRTA